ncbi:hypothetical protein BH10ACI2_BH10ACI2_18810 [soil metagenome]
MILKSKWGKRCEIALGFPAVRVAPNFIEMMTVSDYLGGHAMNGKAVGGHYFVGSHANYHVSRGQQAGHESQP